MGYKRLQCFNANDVTTAQLIKLQQSLGYTLNEVTVQNREYHTGQRSAARTIEVLRKQIAKLEVKPSHPNTAIRFLHDKLNWVESGMTGEAPQLSE